MNVQVFGKGEVADALRQALERVGFAERSGDPAAIVCAADELARAIAMRDLAQATFPLFVLTDNPGAAIVAGADDAGGTPEEVVQRVAARLRVQKAAAEKTLLGLSASSQLALPQEPRSGRGKRPRPLILVAEDDDDARALLVELLAPRYAVEAVADGLSALARAKVLTPDLVLLDLFLPGLDGFAALSMLRRDARTADVPVIFLSAQGDAATKSEGLSLGAADYLAKPFSEQELMARIDRTLRLTAQREHFRALAQTDGLTGLPNFRSFNARLEEELKRADRYAQSLACAMVDLDGLKQINDKLGHAAGNRAIIALGDAVREELRETDFAARYGGDEFVVLLPQANAATGALFAQRLRRRLASVSREASQPVRASIGVSALRPDEVAIPEAAKALVHRADEALYRAKGSGRDRVEVQ